METDLGFDLDTAIFDLHRAALEAGALPQGDFRSSSPGETAEAHLHQIDQLSCAVDHCRTAALCLALYELVQFRDEARNAAKIVEALHATEAFQRDFEKRAREYLPTLEQLLGEGHARQQVAAQRGLVGVEIVPGYLTSSPNSVLVEMTRLKMITERLEKELREAIWSPELQQSTRKRKRNSLLTAVYQHLDWGQFTYAQIGQLVPDTLSGDPKERVRSRVRSADERSILPRELWPRGAEDSAGTTPDSSSSS